MLDDATLTEDTREGSLEFTIKTVKGTVLKLRADRESTRHVWCSAIRRQIQRLAENKLSKILVVGDSKAARALSLLSAPSSPHSPVVKLDVATSATSAEDASFFKEGVGGVVGDTDERSETARWAAEQEVKEDDTSGEAVPVVIAHATFNILEVGSNEMFTDTKKEANTAEQNEEKENVDRAIDAALAEREAEDARQAEVIAETRLLEAVEQARITEAERRLESERLAAVEFEKETARLVELESLRKKNEELAIEKSKVEAEALRLEQEKRARLLVLEEAAEAERRRIVALERAEVLKVEEDARIAAEVVRLENLEKERGVEAERQAWFKAEKEARQAEARAERHRLDALEQARIVEAENMKSVVLKNALDRELCAAAVEEPLDIVIKPRRGSFVTTQITKWETAFEREKRKGNAISIPQPLIPESPPIPSSSSTATAVKK